MAKQVILGTDFGKDALKVKCNANFTELYDFIGTLESLSTEDKTNLVNAINEHEAQINSLDENFQNIQTEVNSHGELINTLDANKVDNSRVLTDVPVNAKFTDTTYSEISTSEIDAGTSSTLRTITGRRVKYIIDKVSTMISTAINGLTKANVGLGNVDNTSDINKPISSATQTALNGKVDNSRVLTDVPLNAKFTDTVTTINGKTGAITKADIVALGIPAQDTTYSNATTSAAGLMSAADKTKLDGIETGANNYVHPTTAGNKHIPSGGAANQYLKYSANGTAVWSDLGDAPSVNGKSIWVGEEGSKGTDANTIYFCY